MPGARLWRWIYVGWYSLITGLIVLQFYLAGYAVFGFSTLRDIGPHRVVGDVITLGMLLGIGSAFLARVPWRMTYVNIGLFVLMVIQGYLAYAGIQGIAALHVVNAVVIFGGTLQLLREAIKFAKTESPAASPATEPARELITR
jgi:hypothetical protein